MFENRLTERLKTYWNDIRKDSEIPEFEHFNVSAIADMMQQCILFTMQPAAAGVTPNVSFYMIGDKLRPIYGAGDMRGQSLNPTHRHFQGAAIVRKVTDIIANPVPISDTGQFVNEKSNVVKYRSCLLPFGRESKVTHIVAGLSWKEF